MRRGSLLILLTCLGVTACGSSKGAKPTLLVVTPNPHVTALPVSSLPLRSRPASTPRASGSRFVFSGPCTFTQTAPVRCVKRGDDFYAYIHRKLAHGYRLDTTINVEHYSRPDTYMGLTQVYMQVSKVLDIYSWANRTATATVARGEHGLTLQPTEALPWAGTPARGIQLIGGTLTCRSIEH